MNKSPLSCTCYCWWSRKEELTTPLIKLFISEHSTIVERVEKRKGSPWKFRILGFFVVHLWFHFSLGGWKRGDHEGCSSIQLSARLTSIKPCPLSLSTHTKTVSKEVSKEKQKSGAEMPVKQRSAHHKKVLNSLENKLISFSSHCWRWVEAKSSTKISFPSPTWFGVAHWNSKLLSLSRTALDVKAFSCVG